MNPYIFAVAYPPLPQHPEESGIHLIFRRFTVAQVVVLDETGVALVLAMAATKINNKMEHAAGKVWISSR